METAEEVQQINSSLWMYIHYMTGSVLLCVSGEPSSDAATQAGVHSLVESLCGLQGERSKLRGELRLLHSQLEQKERDRHSRIQVFQLQVRCCQTAEAPYLFQERHNGEVCMKSSHSVCVINYSYETELLYVTLHECKMTFLGLCRGGDKLL